LHSQLVNIHLLDLTIDQSSSNFNLDKRTNCHIEVYKREEGYPFLDIECLFFKLVFEQYEQLEDLSTMNNAERGALTTFIEAVKAGAGDIEKFTNEYYLSIKLKYDFPYGVGLGSSASFNVALGAAAFTVARKLTEGNYKEMTDISFEKEKEQWKIRSFADAGERAAHKTISGTETAVISLGGIYKYCKIHESALTNNYHIARNMKGLKEIKEQSEGLKITEDFHFDLINTGISRSTKDQLDDMVTMHQQYPGNIFILISHRYFLGF